MSSNTSQTLSAAEVSRRERIYGKPRSKWGYRFLFLLFCLLASAVWFAPTVIARTSLRQYVATLLLPKYPGAIDIGSAELDWLAPVVIRNLKAEDTDGHPLLDVNEVSTTLPLWRLITQPSKLGRVRIQEPQLNIALRPGGSNLEDVVQKLMEERSERRPPEFELEVIDATIVLDHKLASLSSTVTPVSFILTARRGVVEELELTVGQVPSPTEASLSPATDWLAFRYGSQPTQDDVAMTPGSKHLRLKAQKWKLDKFLPVLIRFEPHAEFAGEIDADARSQTERSDASKRWVEREWSWDGKITAHNLKMKGVSVFNHDPIDVEAASIAGRIAVAQGRLSMDRLQCKTDFGDFGGSGDIPLASVDDPSPTNAVTSFLEEHDYHVHSHLDLQKLALMLPNTLRVREGTRITSGRLDVDVTSDDKDKSGRRWIAEASINGLAGTNGGRSVAWDVPLRVTMRAHRSQNIVTVDEVTCQSDFMKLDGGGTLTDAHFTATADLNRLEASVQQLVDLGLQKLAGQLKASGKIRRTDGDRVVLESVMELDKFDWSASNRDLWQEPHLVLSLNAAGRTDDNIKLKQIDTAELKLTSAGDSLTVTLLEGVDLDAKPITWPTKSVVVGELRTWQNRIRPAFGDIDWQLAGQALIEATLTVSTSYCELMKLSGTVTSFEARSTSLFIKEPKFVLETSGKWLAEQREWSSPLSTLTGTSLSCHIENLLVDLKPAGGLERVAGDAAFRVDLDRISRWRTKRDYYFAGILEGKGSLSEHESVILFDADATITKMVAMDLETAPNQQPKWVTLWNEPQLHLIGKGSYSLPSDGLELESTSVQADGLGLSLNGKVEQVTSIQRVDLSGQLDYDWEPLSQRMGESLRKMIQLTGKDNRPFALKGTLASLTSAPADGVVRPSDLSGSAGIGWQSAVFQGLPMGPTDISVRLEQGVGQFAPIEASLADGRLHLTPSIQFNRSPALVLLPAEKVLDEVQLSPQLCNTWLKFIAPMLADATQINGKFSLDVAGGALPLGSPQTGDLGGVLTIHQAQMRPGPSAAAGLGLLEQIQSIIQRRPRGNAPNQRIFMELPEQPVNFRLANGRVSNDGVTFVIGDAIMKSSGTVGLVDDSLDIVLQIPIRDDWVADKKLLQGLKGQTLQIPVRGTVSQPQIDGSVLGELANKMGGAALNGVLEDKINNIFDKKLKNFLPGQD